MSILLTKPDDSPLDGITLTAERGVPSAHVQVKILNDGSDPVTGGFIVAYAETSPGSGVYSSSGQPVMDELQLRFQITDQDSTVTPGQEFTPGQIQPMGHLAVADLPDILPGDWFVADLWVEQSGSSAGGSAINIKIEFANDVTAFPLPRGNSARGVESGIGKSKSFWIENRFVTPTGSPDDQIHVSGGRWLIAGVQVNDDSTTRDLTLDQTDSASATLASGESYIACISQSASSLVPTVTKGTKAMSPTRPSPPSGELVLAWITVSYQAGGTSVIAGADIDRDLTFGRYRVTAPASGLTAIVHAGNAIIGDFAQIRTVRGAVSLVASASNRIWLEDSGIITVTQDDTPPSAGALCLAIAITNATDITTLTDTRPFLVPDWSDNPQSMVLTDAADNLDMPVGSYSPEVIVYLTGCTTVANLNSVQAPFFAQRMHLVNKSSGVITLKDEDGSGAAQNELVTGSGSDLSYSAVDQITSWTYDRFQKVWRMTSKNF